MTVKNFATGLLLESVLFQNGAQRAINPVVRGEAFPSRALTRFSPVYVIHFHMCICAAFVQHFSRYNGRNI